MNRPLFNAMKDELGICAYNGETESSILTRTLYSACAKWIRFFVIDQDENGKPYPKSKHYILHRGKETISHLIDTFPEIRGWFASEDGDWPYMEFIREMRALMMGACEFLLDDAGRLMLPEYTQRPIAEGIVRVYGMPKDMGKRDEGEYYAGIARIKEGITAKEPFFLRVASEVFTEDIFSSAIYSPCPDMERFEFFNPDSKAPLYQSWENIPGGNRRYALGRMQIINGMYEYYLFRKPGGGSWENSSFPDYYRERGEHRRIMLAQRAEAGNPMRALYRDYGNLYAIKLYCRIPLQQETQLRTYGWPTNAFSDMFNYRIPRQVWPIVKDICRELCIELQNTEQRL